LLSFKKHNPEADLFFLCSEIGDQNRALCERCSISVVELDLTRHFHREWDYPRECFYHFASPCIFGDKGYEQSIYLDGDTYCNGPLRGEISGGVALAGFGYDTLGDFFHGLGEPEVLKSIFKLSSSSLCRKRIQSGVILHNNKDLLKLGYFQKAINIYDLCLSSGVPRKGDDSLLALLMAAHEDIKTQQLTAMHNVIDFHVDPAQFKVDECIVYHFCAQKPWFFYDEFCNYAHLHFVRKWLAIVDECFTNFDIERCFPDYAFRRSPGYISG